VRQLSLIATEELDARGVALCGGARAATLHVTFAREPARAFGALARWREPAAGFAIF
jgi:hypothetical protein